MNSGQLTTTERGFSFVFGAQCSLPGLVSAASLGASRRFPTPFGAARQPGDPRGLTRGVQHRTHPRLTRRCGRTCRIPIFRLGRAQISSRYFDDFAPNLATYMYSTKFAPPRLAARQKNTAKLRFGRIRTAQIFLVVSEARYVPSTHASYLTHVGRAARARCATAWQRRRARGGRRPGSMPRSRVKPGSSAK